jgi:outer membrane lipoprotein-sorting protein
MAVAGLAALVLGAASASAAPGLSTEQQGLEDKAVNYLQGLTSAQGRFVQTDSKGVRTEGTFFLDRPGRIRFEYDPPAQMIVVSDGHNVTVYDRRLQTANFYPLSLTPLHVFLAKTIRFDKAAVVDKVERTPGGFEIVAHDGKHANQGSIALEFSDSPVRLVEWTITDGAGRHTQVQLTSLKPSGGFDAKTFTISEADRKPR